MNIYGNKNEKSGVAKYRIEENSLLIEFTNGNQYLYDDVKPGRVILEEMKKYAIAGEGLNTYINKVVRKNFSKRII